LHGYFAQDFEFKMEFRKLVAGGRFVEPLSIELR
jgi:hypothetical protein